MGALCNYWFPFPSPWQFFRRRCNEDIDSMSYASVVSFIAPLAVPLLHPLVLWLWSSCLFKPATSGGEGHPEKCTRGATEIVKCREKKTKLRNKKRRKKVGEGQAAPWSRTSFPSIAKNYLSSDFEFWLPPFIVRSQFHVDSVWFWPSCPFAFLCAIQISFV